MGFEQCAGSGALMRCFIAWAGWAGCQALVCSCYFRSNEACAALGRVPGRAARLLGLAGITGWCCLALTVRSVECVGCFCALEYVKPLP